MANNVTSMSNLKNLINSKKRILKGFWRKNQKIANFIQNVRLKLNFSKLGVLGTRDKSETHDCKRNLSPIILKGNQVVYS